MMDDCYGYYFSTKKLKMYQHFFNIHGMQWLDENILKWVCSIYVLFIVITHNRLCVLCMYVCAC